MPAIQESHRIFNCARCHRQVLICSRCDRGQRYCGLCSQEVRCRAVREAASRYQRTPHGALNHARRQERYRGRLREKVTHQGSPPARAVRESEPLIVTVAVTTAEARVEVLDGEPEKDGAVLKELQEAPVPEGERQGGEEALGEEVKMTVRLSALKPLSDSSRLPYRCHFCGRPCGVFSRLDFLRERRR